MSYNSIPFLFGVISFNERNYDSALQHFKKSYYISVNEGEERYQLDNINYIAQIFIRRSQPDSSIVYLRRAEKLIRPDIPYDLELIKIYAQFAEAYARLGDSRRTAFYQNRYKQLRDSTYNEELTNNLMRIETEFAERKNQSKIQGQAQELKITEKIISRQRWINFLAGLIVVLLITLAITLIKSISHKQRENELLDQVVREKTKDLELGNEDILKVNHETSILISRTTSDMKSALTTMKGLCIVALQDVKDEQFRKSIAQIDKSSETLIRSLETITLADSNKQS